jgi:hypothetical protein
MNDVQRVPEKNGALAGETGASSQKQRPTGICCDWRLSPWF